MSYAGQEDRTKAGAERKAVRRTKVKPDVRKSGEHPLIFHRFLETAFLPLGTLSSHIPHSSNMATTQIHCLPSFSHMTGPVQSQLSMALPTGSSQMVKNLSAIQVTRVQSLSLEDPLEKGLATYSSILACRIPWTKEPGGLQSMVPQGVGHD